MVFIRQILLIKYKHNLSLCFPPQEAILFLSEIMTLCMVMLLSTTKLEVWTMEGITFLHESLSLVSVTWLNITKVSKN